MDEEEIKYEDLTDDQKRVADDILKGYSDWMFCWPRRSGKTFLLKYLIQELKKIDKNQ